MAPNPAKRGALRALSLTMTALLLSVGILAPGALGHDILPLNAIANGGFESGYSGWTESCFAHGNTNCPQLSIATSGSCLDQQALAVKNVFAGGYLQQFFPAFDGLVLDASVKVLANPANTGPNSLQVMDGPNMVARITIASNQVAVIVYNNFFSPLLVPLPSPSDCHHVQVVLDGVTRTGIVLLDGLPVGTAAGVSTAPTAVSRLLVGDIAGYDFSAGPAPDVQWDGIYIGPKV